MTFATLQQAMADSLFTGLASAADILAAGNASVIVSTSAGVLWTYDGVAVQFGSSQAEALGAAISEAGFPLAAQSYVSKGIDLSLDLVQTQLTAIAVAFPAVASTCNALKAIGLTMGTSWVKWGLSQPTLDDITAALHAVAEQSTVLNAMGSQINPYVNSGTATIEGLKSLVNSLTAPS